MDWHNGNLVVYHGTTLSSAENIVENGIDLGIGRSALDFGGGFYVTTNLIQAERWANRRAKGQRGGPSAAVVNFSLDRDVMARLESTAFVRGDEAFHDFVAFNRIGGVAHGRRSGTEYDVVIGPLAGFPNRLIFDDCDQFSFHCERAAAALRVIEIREPAVGRYFRS